MEQQDIHPLLDRPSVSRARPLLLWLFFVGFVVGGFYAGSLALPRILGLAGTVSSPDVAQRLLPFDIAPGVPGRAPDWDVRERVNILILGIDRRSTEERDAPARTDTVMVLTIDPYSESAGVLSIPRDLWVPIPIKPGIDLQDRINTANVYGEVNGYPGGGPVLAKETVQYNLGVRIHYYVLLDFEGFKRMIDTLGGVTVELPTPLIDDQYPTPDHKTRSIFIPAGVQQLDGEHALWYVRSRHQDSDFGRIGRQQQLLLAIRQRLVQLEMIPRLPQLWGEFRDSVETDIPLSALVNLAKVARNIDEGDISHSTLAVDAGYVTPTVTSDGLAVLIPNRGRIRALVAEVFFDARQEEEAARIEVLDGTSTPGLAAQMAKQLEDYGFDHITIGAINGGPHLITQVQNLSGKHYTATLVASLLRLPKDRVQRVPSGGDHGVDVRVILGDDIR